MNGTNQAHALETRGVSKSFGGVHAVQSVDITVQVGERRALIGPNGAGKTTLFNLITGELVADEGRILLFDRDISSHSVQKRARQGLGRTYQISQLFLELTVEQNLYLASGINKNLEFSFFKYWFSDNDTRQWVRRVARQVGLEGSLQQVVSELSHGMQRQLEIGLAMAMKPKIVMLDEPAAGLSPSEREELKKLLVELPRDITMVLIEHDMDLVLDIAERIDVLHRGRLIASDTPERIRTNEKVQEVYLGSAYVD